MEFECKIRFPHFVNQLPAMQTHSTEALGAGFNNGLLEDPNKRASSVLLFKICEYQLDICAANLQ